MITIHSIRDISPRQAFLIDQIDRNADQFGHHTAVLPKIQKDMMTQLLKEEVHGQRN